MPSLLQMTQAQKGPPALDLSPMQPRQQKEMRDFSDAGVTRQLIFDNALHAASNLPPMENAKHRLELANLHYHGPDRYSVADRKKAILTGSTLDRRLRGTWRLVDKNTGKPVDEKTTTVAKIPYMTDAGTFVHGGNEYTLSNQMRLMSGMFARIKDNGELETHANILPGQGMAHRYFLDPEKGIFYMRLQQAKIPLMPLLRAMGATDDQIRSAWGPKLFAANASAASPALLNKYYEKLVRNKEFDADDRTKAHAVRDAILGMQLNPEVAKRTLGKNFDHLSNDAVLAATKKLLDVSRGEAEVDDRDHLAYQTFMGPEDLFAERLSKDYNQLRRQLFNRASWNGNLDAVTPGALTRQVQGALLNSGLGQALEEINPADVFDKQYRISRLGEGGIPSVEAVPDEARAVQPSHFGFIDPLRTPESFKVGVDVYLSSAAKKGKDGRIYSPFVNPSTGKTVYRSPQDVADLAIAFPGEMGREAKRVFAMQGGRIRAVPKDKIDLVMPNFERAFSPLGNMVPLKSMVKGQRMAMASRMMTQALPVAEPESPLVQAGDSDGPDSFESRYGRYMGAVRADRPGRVVSVGPDSVVVRYNNGAEETHELYNNFPYNRKTYIHQTATVRPGQTVRAGDLLARSNYTDEKGVTALGKNARVAYIPFRGMNFEDAVVISQAYANKMSSEHMYQHSADFAKEDKRSKNDFISLFPAKYDRRQMETIGKNGAVRPGTEVHHGDPLVLAASPRAQGHHKVHKRKSRSYNDESLVWKHHQPGVVTDVVETDKGTTVLVKSVMPMKEGDKLSGRYGDKGIISEIVPDDEMPHDRDGQPYEVLLNPLGVITRTNPAQVVEAVLGRIAAKQGKPVVIPDFEEIDDLTQWAIEQAQRAGISDLEDVVDPDTQRKIPQILTGNRFFMKLHHTAEDKGQGRSTGGYTMDELPAKGGETGAKRVSLMDTNALLSHGATEVLRDSSVVRGQRNEDYFLAFMQGHNPPSPKVPFVFRKFVNELKASGINVVPDGGNLNIMAMTDKDVQQLAGTREVTSGDTVNFDKGLEPVAGGLFDPKLTGGHNGNRWSYVKLREPMPNPVMEEPIRRMLGLTQNKFNDIIACRDSIDGECGPKAIKGALAKINMPREIMRARMEIKGSRKGARDQAIRKLGYLKSAQRLGIHPQDWMMSRVPVLPPMFRPISVMSDSEIPIVSDPNYLYKELIEANDLLKEMQGEVEDVGEEQLSVYKAFKAVTGLGDPVHPKLQEKRVKGILKHIFGSSPKLGTVQRRLLSSPVDFVGRAVISPDPSLDMDHVGLPEDKAWEVYNDFIVRRLRRRGLPLMEALRQAEERTGDAREELLKEIEERPVFITRAPVLHRFGVLAFWPKLTKGDTLKISPLIVKGFNADFDGDAMQYHVPVGNEAKEEAVERMLPSRNLLSPADFETPVHMPSQEYAGGLYAASLKNQKQKSAVYYPDAKSAIQAYLRGEVPLNAKVRIGG